MRKDSICAGRRQQRPTDFRVKNPTNFDNLEYVPGPSAVVPATNRSLFLRPLITEFHLLITMFYDIKIHKIYIEQKIIHYSALK